MKKTSIILIAFLFTSFMVKGQEPGFFLDDWEPKSIEITDYTSVSKPSESASAYVNIDYADEITPVSKYLFGNNTNPYMTQMVDQPTLLQYIKDVSPNIIRMGGSVSDIYFWDMEPGEDYDDLPEELIDGSDGSVDEASYWYGRNTSSWTLCLDNFYEMLDMTGQTGMLTVNYGYARYGLSADPVGQAAHYAADWVRYDNGRTKYWEIGNENFGTWEAGYLIDTSKNQDGQPDTINGGLYGKHFKIFADSMRKAADEIGATIYIGAQLIYYDAQNNTWNPVEVDWNELYFEEAGNDADFYIVHDYYTTYNENSTVEAILETPDTESENVMDWMLTTTSNAGVDMKPIAMTEYNIFAVGSNQMVSHINGMHATMTVCNLIENKFGQASRWDLANGWNNGDDHGMFNNGDEPGDVPQWHPRPDFYHLYYTQKCFGDRSVKSTSSGNSDIQSYASKFTSGQAAVVIANKGRTDDVVQLTFDNFTPGTRYYWYTLEGEESDDTDFSRKVYVNGYGPDYVSGGPSNYDSIAPRSALSSGGVILEVPALSITHVVIDNGGSDSTNQSPVAEISASVLSGAIPLTVDFSGEGSTDPDGDDLTYSWDFGDGSNATGSTTTHTYNTAGDYTATLTVFDGTNIDQASTDISAIADGATCDSPTIASLPIDQDGSGEYCWEVTGTIEFVNSWGTYSMYINGEDLTNTYSTDIPETINGKYYIYYSAGNDWSHLTVSGTDASTSGFEGSNVSLKDQSAQSMGDQASEVEINCYPNPVNNELNVQFNREISEMVDISLIDATGKIILTDKASGTNHTLNMRGLPNGMYMVRVSGANLYIVKSLVKKSE